MRRRRKQRTTWLRSVILGLDDGLVTTLVAVMALSSTASTHLLTVMLGVVLASSVSMALGGYASAKLSDDAKPVLQGVETGAAFLVGGIAPLIPVAFNMPHVQWWSFAATALVALACGALKARYTDQSRGMLSSALFFLIIVSAGTLAGVVIGLVLQ